ncbi:MAG: acyl-CoA dehydrogenase, partial [Blastocatellia bacterium]|nr:acyl-CoA dehydrogenase [Blastocatellia bacterium]
MKNSLFFDSYHSDLIAEIDSFTKTHEEFLENSDSSSHAIEIVKLLGSIGLLKLTVPATYGGKFEKLDSR